MLGLVALPAMMERKYQKELATGSICAAGCLGILIPPSLMLILYGPMSGISVGKLFIAAIPSGLVLSGLYMGYILVRCLINPSLGPALPKEEIDAVSLAEKVRLLCTSLVPPALLIGSVLGSIFFGLATPTDSRPELGNPEGSNTHTPSPWPKCLATWSRNSPRKGASSHVSQPMKP